jgi:hypothetical protein
MTSYNFLTNIRSKTAARAIRIGSFTATELSGLDEIMVNVSERCTLVKHNARFVL